ncbi:ribonuclease [Streptomyces sp. NBC_01433]|uniref:ribonuclease domain-containing protein n=1 Tax=Streptomyces sp. NBC_01433 TaxID=2903864 RepID=UPI00224EE765|nr:ribonuclease domain-containing protein [Streptomyces sp. NBC_01433]MCX4680433.1 ribonuclease [Streptomyces sp. NBC_01433]
MRIPPRITMLGGTAALLSVLFASGPVTANAATPPSPAVPLSSSSFSAAHAAPFASPFTATSVGSICYSDLPSQAHDTLGLIDAGGPFPYDQDGTVFQNREGVLPSQGTGYYHEYTVITPGSPTRGARRIVTGEEVQEDYYTGDHYASFDLVDHDC